MAKISAFGTTLYWDAAGGTTWVEIGQVENIGGPGLARDAIEVTTHDSTSAWREFIKGLKDGGELTFDIVYDPALSAHGASAGLLSDFGSETTLPAWKLEFPDTGTTEWLFDGFLTGFEPSEPIDDKLAASITVKLTGVPTLV